MTTKKITSDADLTNLLNTLGSTAEEVANTLRAAGVRGERRRCGKCPVAHWLLANTTGYNIEVDPSVIDMWNYSEVFSVYTPTPVANFIRNFDYTKAFDDLLEVAP